MQLTARRYAHSASKLAVANVSLERSCHLRGGDAGGKGGADGGGLRDDYLNLGRVAPGGC